MRFPFLITAFLFSMSLPMAAANLRVMERLGTSSRELVVSMSDLLDATVIIEVTGQNITTTPPSPIVLDTAGRNNFVAATVSPKDPQKAWSMRYHFRWVVGGRSGQPDRYTYSPPFQRGATFDVVQGYLGTFSHQECTDSQYSIDWRMPEGTPICAARDGMVVAVKQDSNVGGNHASYNDKANFVTLRHKDGTYSDYVHLKLKGALVKIGQTVQAGQRIGLSGNTGYSTAPHVHFAVFRTTMDGATVKRETLPVLFNDVDHRFTSPRSSCAPQGSVPAPPPPPKRAADLVLNGVWKSADSHMAIINGEMFKQGEKAKMKLADQTLEIVCQQIREDSVTVLINGSETRELILVK